MMQPGNPAQAFSRPSSRRALCLEIAIVLGVTFGTSGLRSLLHLIEAATATERLNQQSTTLNVSRATNELIDLGLQLCSVVSLFAWGALGLYFLGPAAGRLLRFQRSDAPSGLLLAALVGLPGLVLYVGALHLGWSKQVVPSSLDDVWWRLPVLLLFAAANAFAEESVVVAWLFTRLRQLGCSARVSIVLCALLRGSYHLYQGFSAGVGNVAMGLLFGWYFHRSGKLWPLILAHFCIDAVAFVGYALLAGVLGNFGL